MSTRVAVMLAICAGMAGCVTPPPGTTPVRRAPAATLSPSAPASTELLEARHHERAQAYARERNWADALVEWELLTLLKPDAQEYRDALIETRKRIRETTDGLSRTAEQARRQGNLDQATLLYLRVLNVERDNAAAAQALRDIDSERTQRSYINRPPRMVM
jgi:tetratricopeptide (TPR) repeat protein